MRHENLEISVANIFVFISGTVDDTTFSSALCTSFQLLGINNFTLTKDDRSNLIFATVEPMLAAPYPLGPCTSATETKKSYEDLRVASASRDPEVVKVVEAVILT
jgi:hypothetical protein